MDFHLSHDTPLGAPGFAPGLIHKCAGSKTLAVARNLATRAIIETKRIDGKPAHRLEGTPPGVWIVSKSEIDAMLDRVQTETGAKRSEILYDVGIDSSSASRCRAGKLQFQELWVLVLSDYSGIPVSELRQVACMEPATYPHHKARRVP